MNITMSKHQNGIGYRLLCGFIAFTFIFTMVLPPQVAAQLMPASVLNLPMPGAMVTVTPAFMPAMLTGINLYPDDPLKFDFLVDEGESGLEGAAFEAESEKLIKYFLAALTVPEDEIWVNLSPYEKDRIIPGSFGRTEMGRDLLAQDYLLKQLTASLMYPEDDLGATFWKQVREEAYEKFGTTEIPMNTFNKIWIVPEEASIFEHAKGAMVVKSRLKVMMEEDYLALDVNVNSDKHGLGTMEMEDIEVLSGVQSQVVREVLLPAIEREVNEGETFANLRQIFNAVILATWYKEALKDSLLGQVYVDKKKTKGIRVEDPTINQQIYEQYVEAFEKGVYNYIKEDYDPATQEMIPRKYFSGGAVLDVNDLGRETSESPIVRRGFNKEDGIKKIAATISPIGVELGNNFSAAESPAFTVKVVGNNAIFSDGEEGGITITINKDKKTLLLSAGASGRDLQLLQAKDVTQLSGPGRDTLEVQGKNVVGLGRNGEGDKEGRRLFVVLEDETNPNEFKNFVIVNKNLGSIEYISESYFNRLKEKGHVQSFYEGASSIDEIIKKIKSEQVQQPIDNSKLGDGVIEMRDVLVKQLKKYQRKHEELPPLEDIEKWVIMVKRGFGLIDGESVNAQLERAFKGKKLATAVWNFIIEVEAKSGNVKYPDKFYDKAIADFKQVYEKEFKTAASPVAYDIEMRTLNSMVGLLSDDDRYESIREKLKAVRRVSDDDLILYVGDLNDLSAADIREKARQLLAEIQSSRAATDGEKFSLEFERSDNNSVVILTNGVKAKDMVEAFINERITNAVIAESAFLADYMANQLERAAGETSDQQHDAIWSGPEGYQSTLAYKILEEARSKEIGISISLVHSPEGVIIWAYPDSVEDAVAHLRRVNQVASSPIKNEVKKTILAALALTTLSGAIAILSDRPDNESALVVAEKGEEKGVEGQIQPGRWIIFMTV